MYLPELPPELRAAAAVAMRETLSTRAALEPTSEVIDASAGFIYTRKGEDTVDLFGTPRNKSYGSPSDDVVLSLTVRIHTSDVPAFPAIAALQRAADDHSIAKLDADIAAAEQAAASAQARVEALKAARKSA